MASATRFAVAATEDPGSFTISSSGDWTANTIAIKGIPVKMDANVDYVQITVTAIVNGVINWYTSATGGSPFGSGAPFNPAGVASSGLPNTSVPGNLSVLVRVFKCTWLQDRGRFYYKSHYLLLL